MALLRLGLPDAVWPLLAFSPDPRVQTETIQSLAHLGAAPDLIAERFLCEPDSSTRMALLLALADCAWRPAISRGSSATLPRVLDSYRNDPDPGVHGAARLLLRRAGRSQDVRQIDDGLEGAGVRDSRRWYVDGGHTMVVIDPTGRNPALSAGRSIDRVFAISSTETTLEQFLRFRPYHPYQKKLGTDPELPRGGRQLVRRDGLLRWLDREYPGAGRRAVLPASRSDQGRHANTPRLPQPHRASPADIRRVGVCSPRPDYDSPTLRRTRRPSRRLRLVFTRIPATACTRLAA